MARPRNRGWFKARYMNGGKVDPRCNLKGRRLGSRNKYPRALMQRCPVCGYHPSKPEHRAWLRRWKRENGRR